MMTSRRCAYLSVGFALVLFNGAGSICAAETPEIFVQMGHATEVVCATLSPDGRYLLSTAFGQSKVWEAGTGRLIRTFKYPPGESLPVLSVILPDNRRVLSKTLGGSFLRLWDLESDSEIKTLNIFDTPKAMVASPDGRYVLLKDIFRNNVEILDIQTGKQVWSRAGIFQATAVSEDFQYVLTGAFNAGDVELMNLRTGQKAWSAKTGAQRGINAVAILGRRQMAAVVDLDGILCWLDLKTGNPIGGKVKIPHDAVYSVWFFPDGERALVKKDKVWSLWDTLSGRFLRTTKLHEEISDFPIEGVIKAFSPDGRYFATAAENVYAADSMEKILHLAGGRITTVAVQDQFTVTGDKDGNVIFRDNKTGGEIRRFETTHYRQTYVAIKFGKYVATSAKSKMIAWDVERGSFVTTADDAEKMRGYAPEEAFGQNGKLLVSGNSESLDGRFAASVDENGQGTLKLRHAESKKDIAEFVLFTNGEWIVIMPEGYFNASPNGARHLNVRMGNRVSGVDQFYAKFYRPELVQLALSGQPIPQTETFGDILAQKPAPEVQILSPVSGSSVEADSIEVSLKISDNGGGVGNIVLYLNGSQVANQTRGLAVKERDKTISFTLSLLEGQNEIKAIAFNRDNSMESVPAVVSVLSRAAMRKPNLYALVIGINEYKNKSISLNYAVTDARAFAETLKKTAGPLFNSVKVQLLTTPEETTKEAIAGALEKLRSQVKPNDLFVFYNASHGVVDVVDGEEQYFLLTSNVLLLSSRHIGEETLGQRELAGLIGSIPAQKKLVILDTCNAGKGGKEIQVALLQQTRGLTESTAVKLLQRAIGSAVFSASSDTQLALEGYNGHGLFTYVLLEGLRGKADIKQDGYITVLGLADYVEENVVRLSEEVFKRQQTPTIQTGANFPIGKVK